jgi:hypothetical protein
MGKSGDYKPGLTYENWAEQILSQTKIDGKFLV